MRKVIAFTIAFALLGCVETSKTAQTDAAPEKEVTAGWLPLSFSQVKSRYSGYSYRVISSESNGSIYFIGSNGRFLAFDPTEDMVPPRYFDGGRAFMKVIPNHEVGAKRQPVEAICANDELTGQKMRLCHTFVEKGGVVYLYGNKDLPLEFFKGYGPIAERTLQRADLINDTTVLKLLSGEFPDFKAAAAAYDKWEARNAKGRAFVSAQKRREAEQAAATLATVGWVIGVGLNAIQDAARAPSSDGAMYEATPETGVSEQDRQSGISVSESGIVRENGLEIGRVEVQWGYNIICANGYNYGSDSVFGGSFKADVDSMDEAVAVVLSACKR